MVEIASIKSHLRDAYGALQAAGIPILSLHPMFGPGKNLYEPLTMVHAVLRDEEPERAALGELLTHPYLDLISVPLHRHDRLMGWVLGLAHLTGILFGGALCRSGLDPAELGRVASTTFETVLAAAAAALPSDL